MSLTPNTPPHPGARGLVIGGCRLGEVIGRGGTGTVYRAVQLGVDRPVAVKLVPVTLGDARTIARFEREARIAGALEHPHCLPVYAAGEEQGLLYLVMRLVSGSDLSALTRSQGSLPADEAVQVIEQVAGALDAAHRAGLVHRDLKPSNILLDRGANGVHAYLADFGLMRAVADPDPVTESGEWVGTPRYAAPEQWRGEAIGPAADIYALGEVLQVLLSSLAGQSKAMRAVIARATADDPAARFRTAGELAAAARAAINAPRGPGRTRGPGRRAIVAGLLVVGLVAAAAVVAAVALIGAHSQSGGAGVATVSTATVTSPPRLPSDVPVKFTVPGGWAITEDNVLVGDAYWRTRLTGPDGAFAEVDRTPGATGTLATDASGVQHATATRTPGYALISSVTATVGGPAIVWAFSVPGSQRVDIFRRIGDQSYGVLAATASQAESRQIAGSIARTLQRG